MAPYLVMLHEQIKYDEAEDRLTISTSYDAEPVIEDNKEAKAGLNPKAIQKYKGDMVHACRLHEGDVVRLRNLGYNLLSPDPDEVRRALVYVQHNEPHLMRVHSKPFTRRRVKWE